MMLALTLWLSAASCGPSAAESRLGGYMSRLAEAERFSGVILVADHGEVVFEHAVGYADYESAGPHTPDVLFPIASLSKLFTATAILQLWEEGRLDVSDPVVRYLPTFPYPSITLRQLLSHTSGLPPYNAWFDTLRVAEPERVFTNRDFLPRLAEHPLPLHYAPGTDWNYDNVNYIVLAEVVEAVTRAPYSEYIQRRVLEPAGMDRTSYHPSLAFGDSVESFAHPYIWPHRYSIEPMAARRVPYAVEYWHAYQFGGFSGYVSTVADLLRFDRALHDGTLLSDETLRAAHTPVRLADGTVHPAEFGLGWVIGQDSALGTIVYHVGAATGLSSVLLRDLTTGQTVAAFDNAYFGAYDAAMNALRILNGVEVAAPKRSLSRVYGVVLASGSADAALDTLERLRSDTAGYYLDEDELNSLGYDFLGNNTSATYRLPIDRRVDDALTVFRLNTILYPESWNVWDSFGEALLAAGRRDEAVAMYRRSMLLNPANENGRRMLNSLGAGAEVEGSPDE